MEEKFKRSNRRFRTRNAIRRRIKKWLFFNFYVIKNSRMTNEYICTNADREKFVFEGRGFQFLRHTSNQCNCFSCSGEHKFRRTRHILKQKIKKEIQQAIVE